MAVNYNGKKFYGVNLNSSVIYHGILTVQNVGTAVNYYHGIFITLAPMAS
jgi:hypothetical protein